LPLNVKIGFEIDEWNVIPLGWINHGLNDFVEWMFLLHESVSVNESDSIGLDTL